MRNMRTLLFVVLLFPLLSHGQTKKFKYNFDFKVIFGECFHGEEIGLKINSVDIIKGKSLNSNSAGKVNLEVYQSKGQININESGQKTIRLKGFNLKKPLAFQFNFQGKTYNYTYKLNSGPIFLVQYCSNETNGQQVFSVEQRTEPAYFF